MFFSKYCNFYVDFGNGKKTKKKGKIFFDFEIIVFELVALVTRFYLEIILVIACQYVNKQSRDFRY